MSTDWPFSEEQHDFQRSLTRLQPDLPVPDASGSFPVDRWRTLAAAGALAMTAPEVGATALDLVAAGEALGHGGLPGPWWQTLLVVPALPEDEVEAVLAGDLVVTAGTEAMIPWGRDANRVFELGAFDERGWRIRPVSLVEVRDSWRSLGHEPVVAAELVPTGDDHLVAPRAALAARLGLAAYLSGAARRTLGDVAQYAAQRTQFGIRIGDFAAVAHPLAECDARVRGAAALARRAAVALDADPGEDASRAVHTALRATARGAREAVYQAHQTYGAIGFSEEGPLAWLGQRVAQLATEAERLGREVPLAA